MHNKVILYYWKASEEATALVLGHGNTFKEILIQSFLSWHVTFSNINAIAV